MEMNIEKATVSNATAQICLVKSSILHQCLCVLKTVSEFRNLTYRVTKTWNDVEIVVIYREGVLGIFGPPIDPITLILDQNGKCLLYIPFKPVQRVSIISPDSAHVEISSLHAVLRMVAGNGYLFCPGLPERFLAGKACSKFVVLHKVPFKRYQSPQCPVYYQTQALQQRSTKSSLCALCPRCMQVAKWIQSLPVIAPNGAGKAAPQSVQLAAPGKLQADHKNVILDSSISSVISQEVNNCSTLPETLFRLIPLANYNNNSVTSVTGGQQYQIIHPSGNICSQKSSSIDVNGNNQTADVLKNSTDLYSSVNNKMLEGRSFLRNLLQERSKKMDLLTKTKDKNTSSKNETTQLNSNKSQKGKQGHKNICRQCRKEFSTAANLMNHIQRHEALSSSWSKQFRERDKLRSQTSSSFLRMMFRGSKLSSIFQGKKSVRLSDISLRLFLNQLDNVILSHNRNNSLKPQENAGVEYKNVMNETEKQMELDPKSSEFFNFEQQENEALEKRSCRKRTSSGLSPMQTLLKAAVIAEVDRNDVTSPTISSSSASTLLGKQQEMAVVSSTTQSPTGQPDFMEASAPDKKTRKISSRLSSEKIKSNNRITGDKNIHNETEALKSAVTSENNSPLINLNLLSTVSIEKAMRETLATTQNTATISYSVPSTPSSNTRTSSMPTSDSTSYPHQSQHNISQNTSLNTASQVKEPMINVNGSSNAGISPLFIESSSVYPFPSQKQQGQLQSVSSTLFLGNLVTFGNNQPISSTLVTTAKIDLSPHNGCGAIDLSKPKPSQTAANIPAFIEKKPRLALSGLPLSFEQLITSNNNPNPAVLRNLMMITNNSDCKESHPTNTGTSNRQADSDLQARLFACAQNYKIDKGMKNSAQVQSLVATPSGLTPTGKIGKVGGASVVQGEEIQCGYKWTGSGGMVKERTQMVRELVPPHVMANFLSRPCSLSTVTQPISIFLPNKSKPEIGSPQFVLSSKFGQPRPLKAQDMSTSQQALNLTISKFDEASGMSRKSVPSVVISPPSPVCSSAIIAAGSAGISMFKSSLTFSGTLNKQTPSTTLSTAIHTHSSDSLQKLRHKTLHPSQPKCLSPSMLTAAPTTSPSSTISSPSLAAILLQPVPIMHESGHINSHFRFVASPAILDNKHTTVDSSVLSSPASSSVKIEPVDSYNTEQNGPRLTLPIKTERLDPETVTCESPSSPYDSRSPSNLIIDISPETITNRDKGKTLNLGAHPISRAADFASNNISVKCDR